MTGPLTLHGATRIEQARACNINHLHLPCATPAMLVRGGRIFVFRAAAMMTKDQKAKGKDLALRWMTIEKSQNRNGWFLPSLLFVQFQIMTR